MNLSLAVNMEGATSANGSAPSVNPNLLTKTEQLDAAAWVKTNCTVSANSTADPLGGRTADTVDLSFGPGAFVSQTSSVSCATATGTSIVALSTSMTRQSVAGSIDGSPYTWSLWISDPAGSDVQLRMSVVGGFAAVSVRDVGDGASPACWGAKLEVGSVATGDASNYGAVS